MSVSIVATPITGSSTIYRNRGFDISFSIASSLAIDTSLSFSNSTAGVLPYITDDRFKSTTGISTLGALGTIRADVLSSNPRQVTTVTPRSYYGTAGLCTDPFGNIYFAVTDQNRILKLDTSGSITTFAGSGFPGSSNGPRLSAQFNAPVGIATDGSGTFYVTDNYRVRTIDPSGDVSTLAGSAARGFVDASGTSASFYSPNMIAIRPNGDLLVTDLHRIRNLTRAGDVTTYAGTTDAGYVDGPFTRLVTPTRVMIRAITSTSNVYDSSSSGSTWGISNLGIGSKVLSAILNEPVGGQVLYGGRWDSTFNSPVVYQSTVADAVSGATGFTGFSTTSDSINSIAYNGSNLYVAGGEINGTTSGLYYSADGRAWSTAASPGSNVLAACYTVAYGNGRWLAGGSGSNGSSSNLLTSTDGSNWTRSAACPITLIRKILYAGGKWVVVGEGSPNQADSTDGINWTTRTVDTGYGATSNKITTLTYGAGRWVLGSRGIGTSLYYSTDASSWTATTIEFDDINTVFYSALSNKFFATRFPSSNTRTLASSTTGTSWIYETTTSETLIGMTDVSMSLAPFTEYSARMYFPYGLLYDPAGNLYIADQYNNRIRKVAAGTSTMTTFAGTGVDAVTNGTLTTAGVPRPSSLARDSTGTIYAGSFDRNTIQIITGNTISLGAGAYVSAGDTDGAPLTARFNGISGFAIYGNTLYIGEGINGDIRALTTLPNLDPANSPPGYSIVATSNYPITVTSCIDTSWTSVGGALPLYKYEPFVNAFTVNSGVGSGVTLSYAASAAELLGYLSGTGTSNVLFRSTNGANTAYTYSLPLEVQARSGDTVIDAVATSVTINPGRIVLTPSNTALVFYRNEPSPNPVFSLLPAPVQVMYSATTLPAGLRFVKTDSRSFTLTGTPTIQSITSNYTILAQDTAGRTYSTPVTMIVNPERILIDVEGSLSNTGLSSNVPLSPIAFTARFPPYDGFRAINYAWSAPPPSGMQFIRTKNGSNITSQSAIINSTEDVSFGLSLTGTITAAQLESFAKSGITSYPITLTGTRSAGGTPLSPSLPKVISLSFAETVFFDSSLAPLFVGLPVSNMFYRAKTYFPFPTDSSIAGIEIIDGFIPDGLDASFTMSTQKFSFAGTPTAPGSFAFTLQASNTRGTTAALPVTLSTSNDSLTITSSVADTCFNFIQYRDLSNKKEGYYTSPIRYTVTSTANLPTTMTASNLPAGVTLFPNGSGFDLSGLPTEAVGLSTAVLTARSLSTIATVSGDFRYLVSPEAFTFRLDPSANFAFTQNVPITPVRVIASTFSEQPVIRFASPSIPPALQIGNTGGIVGTMLTSNSGSFTVSAFSPYTSGTKTYSYTVTADSVLLQPSVYRTVTAPGCNVSIPINGYSLSALTVSNYRFSNPFPYGLTFNSTTGLLSGTLSTTLPSNVEFTLVGSAGFVDGSLGGTMTTTNLTVNRAQMLRNDYNASFSPTATTLRVYSSDDNGASWTLVYSNASNVYASTIGTNGSTKYLIPTTSNFLLTSSDGANYSRIDYDVAAATPRTSAIVNKPGTSTWWMAGTRDISGGGRGAFLYTSSNDGVTWSRGSEITTGSFTARDLNENYTGEFIPYVSGGVALAYKDGVLMLGGSRILRSTDEGGTWSTVNGGFSEEVAAFSLDHETVWVATGSDGYQTGAQIIQAYNTNANTVCYSVDAGLTWTYGTGGFNMNGYDLRYGGGAWMACGRNGGGNYTQEVRYSFDGATWTLLNAIPSPILESNQPLGVLFQLGALAFDETEWKVVRTLDDGTATLYSHPYDLPMEYGWTATDITASFSGNPLTSVTRFTSYVAQTIDPGPDITTISFPLPNTGPTFVSPAQSTFIFWQYMPIPTITFRAVDGAGTIAYFVSPIPVGLTWDPITQSLSGRCIELGTQTFTVYAKSAVGITAFPVTVIVEVPRIIKQQSGAGAYTSLLRQYTTVNAAQKARDTRAFPTQVSGIGEFASPYPPDVITPSNCPC